MYNRLVLKKNNINIYIKIYITNALTRSRPVTPSSGNALFMLAKVTVVKNSPLQSIGVWLTWW